MMSSLCSVHRREENPYWKELLLRPRVRLEIKFKWILMRQGGKLWTDFIWLGTGTSSMFV